MTSTAIREASINIRALNAQKDLIDKAAVIRNKTRSDFVLEAACREAENVLLDQRLFSLDDETFTAFELALNAPVTENIALRNLLSKEAPWEN